MAGKRKGERASAALPLPSFLPFYFCVHAFSITRTWLSRSLEQPTKKHFSANLNYFTASNRYVKNNGGIDTENGYPYPCNKSCCFDKSKVGAACTGEKMTKTGTVTLFEDHYYWMCLPRSVPIASFKWLVQGVQMAGMYGEVLSISPCSPFVLHLAFLPSIWTSKKSSRSLPSKEERRQGETRQFFILWGKDTKNRFGMD